MSNLNISELITILVVTDKDIENDFINLSTKDKYIFINKIIDFRLESIFIKRIGLDKLSQELDKTIYSKLYRSFNFRKIHTLEIIRSAVEISKTLQINNINYSFLKGFYFLNNSNDLSDRVMRDIDLLLHPDNIDTVVDLLDSLGFYFKDKNFKKFNRIYPGINKYNIGVINENGILVEIHFKIFKDSFDKDCNLSSEILDKKQLSQLGFNIPSAELTAIHILYHGIKKDFFTVGPSMLHDLYKLFSLNNFNFEKFKNYSIKFNLIKESSIALEIIKKYQSSLKHYKLFDDVPEDVIIASLSMIHENNHNPEIIKILAKKKGSVLKGIYKKIFIQKEVVMNEYQINYNYTYFIYFLKRLARLIKNFGIDFFKTSISIRTNSEIKKYKKIINFLEY